MALSLKSLFTAGKSLSPDKMANISLAMGISAILFMLFPSYTLILEIPPGLLSIWYGKQALKNKTGKKITAVSGQVLGLIVLTSFAFEILLSILLLIIRQVWE